MNSPTRRREHTCQENHTVKTSDCALELNLPRPGDDDIALAVQIAKSEMSANKDLATFSRIEQLLVNLMRSLDPNPTDAAQFARKSTMSWFSIFEERPSITYLHTYFLVHCTERKVSPFRMPLELNELILEVCKYYCDPTTKKAWFRIPELEKLFVIDLIKLEEKRQGNEKGISSQGRCQTCTYFHQWVRNNFDGSNAYSKWKRQIRQKYRTVGYGPITHSSIHDDPNSNFVFPLHYFFNK